ncbi:hypothetical protein CTI12_AA383650 [Artemisia annua]|uniref:Uncharacterized protein n=1 Tax=Artemisia annua TaxID=35608 RepID=A0A2U1MGB0_ARTAN|nr:hypothetical protein CTI12_AA383650 [Artemisia annua]
MKQIFYRFLELMNLCFFMKRLFEGIDTVGVDSKLKKIVWFKCVRPRFGQITKNFPSTIHPKNDRI